MKRLLFQMSLCIGLSVSLSSFKLADRLMEGQEGSYIVTEQDRTCSLLLIKTAKPDSLIFEEISLPSDLRKKNSPSWKQWLLDGAPGHSSWIQYEINPTTLKLVEAYSFSRRGWLYLDESDHFLSKLLSLPLNPITLTQRKKIGPAPKGDEVDVRKSWNPPVFIEGKKHKAFCEAWQTTWPEDTSLLSSCQITLYFPPKELSTFPSWIEATNGHYHYAIKVLDSGQNMRCDLTAKMPYRPPQLLKHAKKPGNIVEIPLKAPTYYTSFALYAFDLSRPHDRIGPIPFELKEGSKKEDKLLSVSLGYLQTLFQKNHHYKWLLLTQAPDSFMIESEDYFKWAPSKD